MGEYVGFDVSKEETSFCVKDEGGGVLPPYSPDLNPIELAFAKLKALLRKAAARTIDDLWQVIAQSLDKFTPGECQNFIGHAGYGST